ncbi:Hypothetical protein D9617_6g096070 [Elsinoe fawcettii]|nr:Hypothetical protein D9617_6g096070 [Elsinoe fawcettii]
MSSSSYNKDEPPTMETYQDYIGALVANKTNEILTESQASHLLIAIKIMFTNTEPEGLTHSTIQKLNVAIVANDLSAPTHRGRNIFIFYASMLKKWEDEKGYDASLWMLGEIAKEAYRKATLEDV